MAEHEDIDARRFQREAKLGASLSHPNLVSIFDTDEDDESVLLVMEYVDGETLADLLARGPDRADRAVKIVRAVAEALDHAHAAGSCTATSSPPTSCSAATASVKLADLGIAKAVERTDMTGTDTVLGTPAYMAPGAAPGRPGSGPPVDVYALATWPSRCSPGGRRAAGEPPSRSRIRS